MFAFVQWDNNRVVETIKEESMTGKDRTCTCHIISTQKLIAIIIIVIPNVTVEVKEPEKQHTAETFKTRMVYEDSESHKETKNKFFLIIKRKNISKLMARLDLGKFLGRSLA